MISLHFFPAAISILVLSLVAVSLQNNLGPPCLPVRRNFRLHWPCAEQKTVADELEERQDSESLLRGEPSKFARTGFYDRFFKDMNKPASYDNDFVYWPSYGYNPNLPINGPYRYSNWFAKTQL